MIIKKITINEMIRECNKLIIPFYQREYVWTEKEVKKLLDDIINNENNEYFIGSLVFKFYKGSRIVIDGQQRLSTIWLILKALYKEASDPKNKTIKNILSENNILEIKENLKYFEFDVESLKDGNILNKIIKGGMPLYENEKKNNYFLNYEKILKFFNMYIGRLNEFYDKFKKLISSYVEVDENVDEHILFSQINSTGKKLSAFDLFKNNILSRLGIIFLETKQNNLLDEKINILNNIFSKFNYPEYKIKDIDKLKDSILRHFVSYVTGYLPNSNQESIYEEYLKMKDDYFYDNELGLFEKFCDFVVAYRFAQYSFSDFNYKFNDILSFFNSSFSTYCIVIIDVILKYSSIVDFEVKINKEQEKNIYDALLVLESYKIKRTFVDLKEKVLTRFIPKLPKKINKILEKINPITKFEYSEILYFYLSNYSNDDQIHGKELPHYRMPNDIEFKTQFKRMNIYEHNKFCKEFLIRLSQFDNKTKINFSNFSIEHVLPQNLNKWIENGYSESMEEVNEVLNTIGNLTLTPNNSKYSNNLFLEKVKEMKLSESFVLNNYFFNLTEWNVSLIKERTNYLYEETIRNWDFIDIENKINNKINLLKEICSTENNITDDTNDKYKELIINKSHFKRIKEITIQKINDSLFEYLVNGMSYKSVELKVFQMQFNGYVSEAINRFFGIKDKHKKTFTVEMFENFLYKNSKNISELVSYLNKF